MNIQTKITHIKYTYVNANLLTNLHTHTYMEISHKEKSLMTTPVVSPNL